MLYERKIKYLDYFENGERVRGSGFVKLEAKDRILRMELTVTGLHPTDTFTRDVMLCTEKGENIVGRIDISGGKGKFQHVCRDLENLCGMGIGYGELRGLHIPLGAGREISCSWEEKRVTDTKSAVEAKLKRDSQEKKEEERKENGERNAILPKEVTMQAEIGTDIQVREEKDDIIIPIKKEEPASAPQISPQTSPQTSPVRELRIQDKGSNKENQRENKRENKMPVNLLEDKWSQLCAIYPHIRPFHDEREYLSIGPADFVLFPSNSYKMANNSFLLHGYYNYNHLILVRAEKRGEILYYIGVPGNFFEKEKQVAIMFGFESFECAEEPAQAGDFGYYMMRTEL